MGRKIDYDFGGWATRNNLRCSDGRIIRQNAFIENDGKTVPLVWNHDHSAETGLQNILGHALLENRKEGVYAYCKLNDSKEADDARIRLKHGDIEALSIYANHLKSEGPNVMHGTIKEVSICLAGANPGAVIDTMLLHSDDNDYDDAEIYTGFLIDLPEDAEHSDEDDADEVEEAVEETAEETSEDIEHADNSKEEDKVAEEAKKEVEVEEKESEDEELTMDEVKKIVNGMDKKERDAVSILLGMALASNKDEDEDEDEEDEDDNKDSKEDEEVAHNIFDNEERYEEGEVLTHSDLNDLTAIAMRDAKNFGGSFKDSFIAHAEQDYGIGNVDMLFPDAKTLNNEPDFIKRQDAWVAEVMSGTTHTPFARIKTLFADITTDEARARGYLKKGEKKVDEFFKLAKRETTPTTVYKKNRLDRDDITDATTIDTVNWLMKEMRLMLNEEIARAILIGDGRDPEVQDKIDEEHIRPIASDSDMFTVKVILDNDTASDMELVVEAISKAHKDYRGSEGATLFVPTSVHSDMLWVKDTLHRRIYESDATLAAAMRVAKIVDCPVLDNATVTIKGKEGNPDVTYNVLGIKVNLKDYHVGTDKGGEINNFNDFDIDHNQYKYLMEARMSGALVKWHAAQVILAPQN